MIGRLLLTGNGRISLNWLSLSLGFNCPRRHHLGEQLSFLQLKGMEGRMDSGSSKPWGHTAARTPAINQRQPSIGTDTLKGATTHLHMEHPDHVQGEGLQHRAEEGIHHPV